MNRLTSFLWMTLIILYSGWWYINPVAAQPEIENLTAVRGLALHPDGQILAVGGRYNDQPGIWFYDLMTGTLTGIPTAGNVSMLSWRPDGNVIAAGVGVGEGRTVQVFDTVSGMLLFEFDSESSRRQVLWSADGSQLMTPAGHRVLLRDGSTGAVLQTFAYPESDRRFLTGVAWSETNQRLYGTLDVDRDMLVWDTASGDLITSFALPFVSWGPQLNHAEDKLAVGSNEGDGRVLILDALTGDIVLDMAHDGGGFVLFSPVWSPNDSQLAIFSSVNEPSPIWIWEVATGQILHRIPVQEFTNSQVLVWTNDGESLIFSDGQSFPVSVTPPTADAGHDQVAVADSSGFATGVMSRVRLVPTRVSLRLVPVLVPIRRSNLAAPNPVCVRRAVDDEPFPDVTLRPGVEAFRGE